MTATVTLKFEGVFFKIVSQCLGLEYNVVIL